MLPASVAVSLAAQGAAVVLARRAPRALLAALGGGLFLDVSANIIAEMGHHNLYVINIACLFESIALPLAFIQCAGFGKRLMALIPILIWPIVMYLNGGISAPDRWFSTFEVAWLAAWSLFYLSRAVHAGRGLMDIEFVLPAGIFIKAAAGAVAMFYFSTMLRNNANSLIVLWDVFNYASAVVILGIGVSSCISAPRSN